MRVAVVGAGGIGSYFGGRLAHTGADIHLLARGRRLRAIRDNGLRISGVRGEFAVALPATDDPADIGPCDIVLFCVKSYDTEGAVDLLPPLLHTTTAVVSLQNGVDNEEKIAARIGPEHVLGGAAFIFASVVEPGVVHDAGGPGSLLFGELDGSRSARGEALLAMCEKAGIPAEFVTNIRVRLWDKFAFICAQAGMTACTRLPIGEVRAVPVTWAMFRRIVDEVDRARHRRRSRPPEGDRVEDRPLRPGSSGRGLLVAVRRPRRRSAPGARGAARFRGPAIPRPWPAGADERGRLRAPEGT